MVLTISLVTVAPNLRQWGTESNLRAEPQPNGAFQNKRFLST